MHPVLLQIGSLKVYSYGVFVAIGFLSACGSPAARSPGRGSTARSFSTWILGRSLRHRGGEGVPRPCLLAAIRGGALGDPPLVERGLVFYGGFIAATAACILYLRKHRMPFLPVADASSLGSYWARLRAARMHLCGCCFGKPSTLRGDHFTDPPASRRSTFRSTRRRSTSRPGASPSSAPVRHAGPFKTPGCASGRC